MPLSVDIFNKKILSDQSRFGKYNILLSGEAVNVDLSNYYTKDNPSGFITGVDLSALYPRSNPSGFITGVDLSALYPRSNPSGYITGVDTSSLYPRSNPSGFITGVDTSSLYPRNNPSGFITSKDVVYTTGDQTISNIKTFYNFSTIFGQGNIGQVIIADDNYGGELGITTENNEVIAIKMSDGSFQYGGAFPSVKPPISVLNGNVSFYNTGGNSVYDNPFLTIDNGINKIRFGIQPQDSNAAPPLDDAGFIFDGDAGNQYILEFLNGAAGNSGGKITFNNTGHVAYQQELLNFYTKNNPSGFITGVNLSSYATIANLNSTGNNLQNQINSLSGSAVLIYGNQTIDGTKTFRNSVYIHDLYVTGTEFIANVQNNFIESPYILLNLTGGAVDGGIFFVTGTGLTGVNDYGPILGFDHTDKFKFGIARRSDDLSTLNDIAAVQDITNYSGFVNSNFYGINNPNGYITGIENIVYITGDQLVSGLKTFPDNINTNQIKGITGQFVGNSLSLIGGDGTSFGGPVVIRGGTGVNAGGNIQLNSNVSANRGTNKSLGIQAFRSGQVGEASIDIDDTIFNVKNGLTFQISGETVDPLNYYTKNNPSGFITGVDLSSYVTTSQTGNFYTNNNPSGYITGVDLSNYYTKDNPSGFITGIDLSNYATTGQLNQVNVNLQNQINNLGVNNSIAFAIALG
jgi:hypothetical protein